MRFVAQEQEPRRTSHMNSQAGIPDQSAMRRVSCDVGLRKPSKIARTTKRAGPCRTRRYWCSRRCPTARRQEKLRARARDRRHRGIVGNIGAPVESMYHWQGYHCARRYARRSKTRAVLYPQVEAPIGELHPYGTPGDHRGPHRPRLDFHLDWISAETRGTNVARQAVCAAALA